MHEYILHALFAGLILPPLVMVVIGEIVSRFITDPKTARYVRYGLYRLE